MVTNQEMIRHKNKRFSYTDWNSFDVVVSYHFGDWWIGNKIDDSDTFNLLMRSLMKGLKPIDLIETFGWELDDINALLTNQKVATPEENDLFYKCYGM